MGRFFYELREGARRQGNVVFALIFREIKNRSGQDNYGMLSFLGVVLEPAVGVMALSLVWYLLRRQEIQGIHVALFLTVGMTGFSIVRRGLATIPKSVRSTKSFYTFPNVKPFDAVLARFVIELALTALGGVILLFLCWWFLGVGIRMDRFLEGMGVFALLVVTAFGISLFLGVYGTLYPTLLTALSFGSRGLLLLSGVIHPVSELPSEAAYYISWNPFAHSIEYLRYYFLGMRPFQGVSMAYVANFAFIMLFLGFISYYANRQKLIER